MPGTGVLQFVSWHWLTIDRTMTTPRRGGTIAPSCVQPRLFLRDEQGSLEAGSPAGKFPGRPLICDSGTRASSVAASATVAGKPEGFPSPVGHSPLPTWRWHMLFIWVF